MSARDVVKRIALKSGVLEHTPLKRLLDARGYTFKRLLLRKLFAANGCETFLETGTSYGETTRFMAEFAGLVLTCEPYDPLYRHNVEKNRGLDNIRMWNSGSERCFPDMLRAVKGRPLIFLDGHYSGAGTSLTECYSPILIELELIEAAKFAGGTIVIDDVRLFKSTQNVLSGTFEEGYPELGVTVDRLAQALPGNEIRIVGDCLVSAARF